jgi:hypothetical protein
MDKQELERPIPWRDLDTTLMMNREESFLEPWKKFSNILRTAPTQG